MHEEVRGEKLPYYTRACGYGWRGFSSVQFSSMHTKVARDSCLAHTRIGSELWGVHRGHVSGVWYGLFLFCHAALGGQRYKGKAGAEIETGARARARCIAGVWLAADWTGLDWSCSAFNVAILSYV